MVVKMMIFIFQILAVSMFQPGSAEISQNRSIPYVQENVALRGKATQSAIYGEGVAGFSHASNAIDGNRDAVFKHGSCSCTTNGPNPWWRVDLLQTYVINSVTVTNRGDCCPERISEAQIHIGDSLENNGISNPQCSVISFLGAGETKTFSCGKQMKGRYVTVYLPKTELLTICELEVNAWLPAPPYNG